MTSRHFRSSIIAAVIQVAKVADVQDDIAFNRVVSLCASHLCEPANDHEKQQFKREMTKNLLDRFSSRNSRRHALLIAQDEAGLLVGACGIEVIEMLLDGHSPRTTVEAAESYLRPLLSNLVVHKNFRRRGVARRLVQESEGQARSWGFSELLLKVEKGNTQAEALYLSLGFRQISEDTRAEKPQAGRWCVQWVPTTNRIMLKDMGFDPARSNCGEAAQLRLG